MYTAKDGTVFWNGLAPLSKNEMLLLLNRTATRKEHNTGVLKHLLRRLKKEGSCEYIRGVEIKSVGISRLMLTIERTSRNRYRTNCPDSCVEYLLSRANLYRSTKIKFKVKENFVKKPAIQKPVRLRKLRAQYSHTRITWQQALSILAYAYNFGNRTNDLKAHMRGQTRGTNNSLRIRLQSITMEIELLGGVLLPDDDSKVGLWCEKDNQHRVYRRLRNKLRQTFHLSDKAKRKQAKEIKRMRQWRTRHRLLFAVKQ